jgi:hypothetical protein
LKIQPELDPETTNHNLGPVKNLPEADQDDEEGFYNCRSQSTEVLEECGIGAGNLLPEATLEEPRDLVWGLSKDEWATVMIEGNNPLEGTRSNYRLTGN